MGFNEVPYGMIMGYTMALMVYEWEFFYRVMYGMLIEIITEYTLRYFLDILEPSIFDGELLGSNQSRWGKSGSKMEVDKSVGRSAASRGNDSRGTCPPWGS